MENNELKDTEYIVFVAEKFCHNSPTINSFIKEETKRCVLERFKERYPILSKQYEQQSKKYQSSKEIQNTLESYQLDSNKFWNLFLFLADYSNACFSTKIKFEKLTPRDLAKKIYEELENTQFSPSYKNIEIIINGKRHCTSNPSFYMLLSEAMHNIANNQNTDLDAVSSTKIISNNKQYNVAQMKFFHDMMWYFLKENVKTNKPSRQNFIGKFLYLAKLSFKEEYWDGYILKPKNECQKYEIIQNPLITKDGVDYVKITTNIGKNIADTIKKDKGVPNYSNVIGYFYDAFQYEDLL